MTFRWSGIMLAVGFSVLLLLVEHWGPWQSLLKKKFHPTANYILGVLALLVPVTVLLISWQMWEVLTALWLVTVSGGLAVLGAYALDGWIATRFRANIAEHEAQRLRPGVEDGEGAETT